MTPYVRPVPVSASEDGDVTRLAGSETVRFTQVDVFDRGQTATRQASDHLSAEASKRLSALRADVCGLTFDQPRIMGILNVTPDSFSDGGTLSGIADAVTRAGAMAADVDILDIGGESTRPGAAEVTGSEEIRRTAPVIRAIRDAGITTPISIDTRKAAVAQAALDAGADMVNDVTALRFDRDMASVVAGAGVPVCLMHSVGTPETMQSQANYDDVLCDVYDHLAERIDAATSAGIARDSIIVDPGIGFGKTLQHNVTLLRGLAVYHSLGLPILLGASRKRFIGTLSGEDDAAQRVGGSLAVALHGAAQGVQILRVHDTKQTRQALDLQLALSGTQTYG
ncbi:dihydropteroate synthase [Yoonia sp. 208BN28-4]|uniref:dihydropteroate synthase n=1 Tax=Yoonia sp. 208BN28-4 TaxID=3126505 RepID=UPI0030B0F501